MPKKDRSQDALREELQSKLKISEVQQKFADTAPDENSTRVMPYTGEVQTMETEIDVLDAYDDFGSLKIDNDVYRKDEPSSAYGIEHSDKVHGYDSSVVILPHQKEAARRFLKELRGFGLLADVVGSGKTFEAGIVLSELAYRGKVGSLIIIAPGAVLDSWKDVIEHKFGLGEGALTVITSNFNESKIPANKLVLVDFDAFVRYSASVGSASKLSSAMAFDIIIVDEAHQLYEEKGDGESRVQNKEAFYLISRMIRENSVQYCLLLSATPHSGDLSNMFDLWYFIHFKGGNPEEFRCAPAEHGREYLAARADYISKLCFGAENISDFIAGKKRADFVAKDMEGGSVFKSDMRKRFDKFFESNPRLAAFDNTDKTSPDYMPNGERDKMIDLYLEHSEEDRVAEEWAVAKAYKNLLDGIMIRQPRSEHIRTAKKTVNMFFYPVTGLSENYSIDFNGGMEVSFGQVQKNFPANYYPKLVRSSSGEILDPVRSVCKNKIDYAGFVDSLMGVLGKNNPAADELFREGYKNYYIDMLYNYPDEAVNQSQAGSRPANEAESYSNEYFGGQYNLFTPFEYHTKEDSFRNKMKYTSGILSLHSKERVIIFFDYMLDENRKREYADGSVSESLYDRVNEELSANPDFKDRIIYIDEEGASGTDEVSRAIKRFREQEDAILLIGREGFTHGVNLQQAAVIINFQVTCDPVEMQQQIGRIFRLGQDKNVTIYSLADMFSLEGYALAYFSSIGLFAVDSGDASILAGSNSSEMVSLRCAEGDTATIMSRRDYEEYLAKLKKTFADGSVGYVQRIGEDGKVSFKMEGGKETEPQQVSEKYDTNNELFCPHMHDGYYVRMQRVSNNVYECSSNTAHRLVRSMRSGDEGYKCMNPAQRRTLCTMGETGGGTTLFCNKLCAISNCPWHEREFENCAAVKAYRNGEPYTMCVAKCSECADKVKCENGNRGCRCRPSAVASEAVKNVQECVRCNEHRNSACRYPRPNILEFDEEWNGAGCPVDGCDGTLRIKPLKTFSDHIRYLWNCDISGNIFSEILIDESKKVRGVERMLELAGKNIRQ